MGSFPSGVVILLLVVSESAASNGVDDDEKDEDDNIYNGNFLPVSLQIVQNSGFAGLAIVAQSVCVVIPRITIRIRIRRSGIVWFRPPSRPRVLESALIRRLAATRLQRTEIEF